MTTRRSRGFTLVELMVVVALTTIIASLAIVSMRKSRSQGDADAWANTIRNLTNQVRRRAVATDSTYLLDIRRTQAQWCQCTSSATTACPNTDAGKENGGVVYAGADALTDSYAKAADIQLPGQTYGAQSRTSLSSATDIAPVYFGPSGTASTTWADVQSGKLPAGATLYVRAANATAGSDAESQKKRKVVIYGVSGRPRIVTNW